MNTNKLTPANDSARTKDINGYLLVENNNISKADVNPYYGRDIPNWQNLGLSADKVYAMFRAPDELSKGADSFNGKPLLRGHHDIHSGDIPKDKIIGSIGTDVRFEYPFLVASLTVWDESDIALIEADKIKELSSSYFYRADMTAGEINGVQYDGVMRDIVGNHVAIVEQGRAGSQVAVADSGIKLTNKDIKTMKLEDFKKIFGGLLAKDAKDEDIEEAMKKADDNDDDKKADDNDDKKSDDKACDESKDDKDAKYDDKIEKLKKELSDKQAEIDDYKEKIKGAEDSAKDEEEKRANDAAMIKKEITAEFKAKELAQSSVRPFIGEVALDSAGDIYAAGLKHFGVDITGLPETAFKATFEAVSKSRQSAKANDSAMNSSNGLLSSLPNMKRL